MKFTLYVYFWSEKTTNKYIKWITSFSAMLLKIFKLNMWVVPIARITCVPKNRPHNISLTEHGFIASILLELYYKTAFIFVHCKVVSLERNFQHI